MAAPLDYGTPQRIITMAYRDAGKIGFNQVPDSARFSDALMRLNDLVSHLRTRGIKLWLLEDIPLPLVDGKSMYTFGPGGDVDMTKPFRVEHGYAIDSSGNRREITGMGMVDWVRLSNHLTKGPVTQYYVAKEDPLLKVHLWLTPDAAADSIHLIVRKNADYIETLTESVMFPSEWYLALRWALADELASGAPIAVQQRCQQRASSFIDDLEGFDIENVSTQFVPDFGSCR